MKIMAIFGNAIFALLVCVGVVACSNKAEEIPAEPEFYTIQLGMGGEIVEMTEEPLASRAESNDLYGIQVYSESDSDPTSQWVPYAYGLFDNPENISIKLLANAKYHFVATMVKDGKNKVRYAGGYYTPFTHSTNGCVPVQSEFIYQSDGHCDYLAKGKTWLNNPNDFFERPNTDRYYGKLEGYVPTAENAKATIKMKRTVFGAKFIAVGELANSGTLEVQITDAPKMTLALTDGDDVLFDIFTFKDVAAAWAATGDYTETANVAINWIGSDNAVMPLGTHEVTFKRNTTTVVTVNIEQQSETAGVGFGFDSSEQGNPIEDGKNDITVGGGSTTDTDVDVE